jgi:dolichol-phosphate mannosyltransferase
MTSQPQPAIPGSGALAQAGIATKDPLKVAVVIPTYNEAQNLPVVVEQLAAQGIDGLGFIIVDDGSPDGTGDIARRIGERFSGVFEVLQRSGKQGLGKAYVDGFARALELGADQVVQMDADLSHPPFEVPRMLSKLAEADVVIGSRYVTGGAVDPGWSWLRKQISFWGGFGIRLVLGLKVKDATSGFKAFRASALKAVGIHRLKLTGFGFQPEVTYRCQQAGLRIVEHPFVFMDRTVGKSKMSTGIMIEAFFKLVRLRLRG